ncbi:hypothetical protein Tco_0039111 [Tanacetum coccineum]
MASIFGSKSKSFMTISIPPQDEPLTNRAMNNPRDFAKPVKAISLPQNVSSTSDRRLVELENQVQCLMEAHLAPKQHVQVNKITSSCETCSGPHDTQYCIENLEQAFIEYVSSRTDEAGSKWYIFKPEQNNLGDTYNPSWKSHPNLSHVYRAEKDEDEDYDCESDEMNEDEEVNITSQQNEENEDERFDYTLQNKKDDHTSPSVEINEITTTNEQASKPGKKSDIVYIDLSAYETEDEEDDLNTTKKLVRVKLEKNP